MGWSANLIALICYWYVEVHVCMFRSYGDHSEIMYLMNIISLNNYQFSLALATRNILPSWLITRPKNSSWLLYIACLKHYILVYRPLRSLLINWHYDVTSKCDLAFDLSLQTIISCTDRCRNNHSSTAAECLQWGKVTLATKVISVR